MTQTAVEWFIDLFKDEPRFLNEFSLDIKQAKEIERQQSDDYAIEFVKWYDESNYGIEVYKHLKTYEQVLEIFKKEKGL
jgi:hypothetical protein